MADDFVDRRLWVGLTVDEASHLLGQATSAGTQQIWRLANPRTIGTAEFATEVDSTLVASLLDDEVQLLEATRWVVRPRQRPFEQQEWLAGSVTDRTSMVDDLLAVVEAESWDAARLADSLGPPDAVETTLLHFDVSPRGQDTHQLCLAFVDGRVHHAEIWID